MTVKAFAFYAIFCGITLYLASNWWERAFAHLQSTELSPDGCLRVETFEPFWILPSHLHRLPDPDPAVRHEIGRQWQGPMFKRAYETSTGLLLGETIVFDISSGPANYMFWNASVKPGQRLVLANGFKLVDSDRCADQATLAKLEQSLERERESVRVMHEARQQADRK